MLDFFLVKLLQKQMFSEKTIQAVDPVMNGWSLSGLGLKIKIKMGIVGRKRNYI